MKKSVFTISSSQIPVLLLLTILCLFVFASGNDSVNTVKTDKPVRSLRFLPEYYINGDVGMFLFQQNSTYKKNYLMESDLNFGLDFLSYKRFHTVWDINVRVGVGKQMEDVIFDPRWLTIAIVPTLEYRFNSVITQIGLDRRCFHEVDHDPARMTVYWTLPFVHVGSVNMRLAEYEKRLFEKEGLTPAQQFSWYARSGWFIDKFFSYPATLTGGGHDYKFMLNSGSRYTLVKYGIWALWLSGVTNLYADRNRDWFLTQEFELDNSFHGDRFNITLFLNYVVRDDRQPYKNMNRDKLGEIGLEFIF